ncbi:MAG: hypothetical protein GTO55_07645, partial [Armatimonadetes bacterium]|nr:hypothetical protein [Armatimonadota bacterium]NIM24138.1 hypothetical protein [Armatimonadota bacterium]NIM67997.1 hypothetical protein [Armatimonadota bacterium]NIM76495.1 hypothetical protein [Armatimonadota bacterium]NIN06220.1 hypothetical protein [Armatimonadota bacterium]
MSDFLPIDCPNCGDTVDIAIVELEFLHDGMTVDCPACDGCITFMLFPHDVMAENRNLQADLAALRQRAEEAERKIEEAEQRGYDIAHAIADVRREEAKAEWERKLAQARAEGAREAFEKACTLVCNFCSNKMPLVYSSGVWWHKMTSVSNESYLEICLASAIRYAAIREAAAGAGVGRRKAVKCNCEGYKMGMPQLEAQQLFCLDQAAGPVYTAPKFTYCPWCGVNLETGENLAALRQRAEEAALQSRCIECHEKNRERDCQFPPYLYCTQCGKPFAGIPPRLPYKQMQKRAEEAEAALVEARKVAEWLWGFWDGNTLKATSGMQGDVQAAFEQLMEALLSVAVTAGSD